MGRRLSHTGASRAARQLVRPGPESDPSRPRCAAAVGPSVRLVGMLRRLGLLCFLCVASACHREAPAEAPAKTAANSPGLPTAPSHPPRAHRRWSRWRCATGGLDPLDAARAAYDAREYDRGPLRAPRRPRPAPPTSLTLTASVARSALGKFDEAKLAYARALALDPEHLDSLLGAAHLYGVSLPSSRDNDELAFVYAERGAAGARGGRRRAGGPVRTARGHGGQRPR